MWLYYLNVGLTYFTIAFAAAVFYYFVLRKPALGKFWGALVVAIIGSFLGGLADYLFRDVIALLSDFNSVNIFSALAVSLLFVWILTKVSSTG